MGHMETAFKNITTLRVGGPIVDFRSASSPAELAQIVTQTDAQSTPLVVVGCGSNLLAGDDLFEGTVVRACNAVGPVTLANAASDEGIRVKVNVGCVWDDFVRWCVERDLAGLEALSGIPGQIGSAVMQNLGAYGQEIGTCLTSATLLDRGCRGPRPARPGISHQHAAPKHGRGPRWWPLGSHPALGCPQCRIHLAQAGPQPRGPRTARPCLGLRDGMRDGARGDSRLGV